MMKSRTKYITLIFVLSISIFMLFHNCQNEVNNKQVKPSFTYSEWEYDTWYDYRIAHPDYFGDSSFLLRIYYNSNNEVVRTDLSTVPFEAGDSIKSYLFIDYEVYDTLDGIGFTIPENDKVWIIDLPNYQINVPYEPDCYLCCLCSECPDLDQDCELNYMGRSAWCADLGCKGYSSPNCIGAGCWLTTCDGSITVIGPVAIIEADRLRFNDKLYQ